MYYNDTTNVDNEAEFAGLYTYCLQDGDYFVIERKHQEKCLSSPKLPCSNLLKKSGDSPEKKKLKTIKRNIFLNTTI